MFLLDFFMVIYFFIYDLLLISLFIYSIFYTINYFTTLNTNIIILHANLNYLSLYSPYFHNFYQPSSLAQCLVTRVCLKLYCSRRRVYHRQALVWLRKEQLKSHLPKRTVWFNLWFCYAWYQYRLLPNSHEWKSVDSVSRKTIML